MQRGDSYKSTGRRTELATSYTVSSNNTFTTSNTSLSISDRAGARNSPPADGGTSPDSSTEGGSSSFPNINNNTSMNSSTNQQQETTNTIINNRPKERRLPQSQQEGSFTATQLSSTIQQRPTFRSPTSISSSTGGREHNVVGSGGLNKMSSFKEEELHDSMTLPDVFAEDDTLTSPSDNFNSGGGNNSGLLHNSAKTSSSRSMNSSTNTRRRSNSASTSKNHHSTGSSNNESDESSILLDVSWGSQNYDKAL